MPPAKKNPYAMLLKAAKAAEASMKKVVKKVPVENGYKKLMNAARAAEESMKKLVGVPAKKRVATNFLNNKKRVIFQGPRGGYFAMSPSGKKIYGIRPTYMKNGTKI